MRSCLKTVCFFFLILLPGWAQTPKSLAHQPVTERRLLCWIIAGQPSFNVRYELQTRGVDFVLDQNWLQELRLAGADSDLVSVLQKAPLPSGAIAIRNLALSLSMRGQDLAALQLYRKALSLDPKDPRLLYGAGISYARAHQMDEAIAAYKQAKDLAPDDLRIRQNLGTTYCNSGRYEEAVAEFQELLAIDPDWNMARMCLYRSLSRLGRVEQAAAVKAEYERREAGGSN